MRGSQGIQGLGFRVSGLGFLGPRFRVYGGYKWGFKVPLRRVVSIVTLLITPLITTPPPPETLKPYIEPHRALKGTL